MSELVLGLSTVLEVQQAEGNSFHDVIGMVTDAMPPQKAARGDGDFMSTIHVTDQSLLDSGNKYGVRCKFFRKIEADTPKAQVGDIVCIKHIKVDIFRGVHGLLGCKGTELIVFAREGIPAKSYSATYEGGRTSMAYTTYPVSDTKPTIAEQLHAISLAGEMQPHLEYITKGATSAVPTTKTTSNAGVTTAMANIPTGPAATRRQKFRLLKDVRPNDFADIFVEVVKIFPSPYDDYVELYVTDFTANTGFFDYANPHEKVSDRTVRDGDEYGYLTTGTSRTRDWPGPWGQMTLKVEVHPPHMGYVRSQVNEGANILMTNVRLKVGRDNNLEGNMWPDFKFRDKICIGPLSKSSPERHAFQARKAEYWDHWKTCQASELDKTAAKPQKLTKGQKKKLRREAEEKEAKAAAARAEEKNHANQNVKCAIDNIGISTVRDMIALQGKTKDDFTLPFVNQKRRLKVHVVDFFPPDLEDFSGLFNEEDDGGSDARKSDAAASTWKWSFFLLIQDVVDPGTDATCWVHVANEAAEKLLSQQATDLRSGNLSLHKLREQLFKLWGNLQEIKQRIEAMSAGTQATGDEAGRDRWGGQLSNRPFECCVHEYGQRLDEGDRTDDGSEWIRLHTMTDTAIK